MFEGAAVGVHSPSSKIDTIVPKKTEITDEVDAGDIQKLYDQRKDSFMAMQLRHAEARLLRKTNRNLNIRKICIVGNGRAGKTSLLSVLRGLNFNADEKSTCGIDTCMVHVQEELWSENDGSGSAVDSYEKKMVAVLME